MCVVSNVGDNYGQYPGWPWTPEPPKEPFTNPPQPFKREWEEYLRGLTDQRLATLEERVKALEELMKKARDFDEETGQPDCEKEEKMARLKELAEELGVELNLS